MEASRCKNIRNQRAIRDKKEASDRNFRQCLSGTFERRGRVTPQNNFVFFFANYFEVVLLVFSIIQNHLKPPRNNFQNYFEVREVFLSNSGTLPKNLFATFQKLFWGGG